MSSSVNVLTDSRRNLTERLEREGEGSGRGGEGRGGEGREGSGGEGVEGRGVGGRGGRGGMEERWCAGERDGTDENTMSYKTSSTNLSGV